MNELILNIEKFILNLTFVSLLFFVYYFYVEKNISSFSHKVFITTISAVSIILCMTFPLSLAPGFILDMRQLPFIIGALYGGRRVGFVLLVTLLFYRLFLGWNIGLLATIIHYVSLYFVLMFLIPKFKSRFNVREKLIISSTVTAISYFLGTIPLLILRIELNESGMIAIVSCFLAQLITMTIFVLLIERAKQQRLLIDELKKLEKLKIVSDIAASISHEVRNPLTVTKGFLQLLREKEITDEKKQQYINLSLDELKRAEEIITDYLTFAKPSLNNIEVLELNQELQYVLKVVSPFAMLNNQEIKFENTNRNLCIVGERQKLHQAIINLAKNSIEAMSNGGQLSIKLTETVDDAIITLTDTGVGMSMEQINRLGTPYYTTKEKGTGLGTMVVFSIIKIMQGSIYVESTIGVGTSFTITIPKFKRNQLQIETTK